MKLNHHSTLVRHLLLPFLLLLLLVIPAGDVSAAAKPVEITYCKTISSSKGKVISKITGKKSIPGKYCYLFALPFSQNKITANDKPIARARKSKRMVFSFSLKAQSISSRMYTHFVVASRKKGVYTIISDTRYITNPGQDALYRYRFPTAVSKKGLQVDEYLLEDAAELNVRHAAVNFLISEIFSTPLEQNPELSYSYRYHGKTYWFRRGYIDSYDRQLTALSESDAIVSAILLVRWRDGFTNLIYPSARQPGHSYYAWNTKDGEAREQLQAALSFLGYRYAASSGENGRISNWIVGNEVNNFSVYNFSGAKNLKKHAQIYADQFRMTYNTLKGIYSNARIYISLDHLWNTKVTGGYTAREMLDTFAKLLELQGNIRWNLAYHPYSSPLTEPRFWANTNKQITNSLKSPVINMGNIRVLTNYIQKKYGSNTRIILSEQGYTSVQKGTNVETLQSAAIAYSYYLTESNDMIDSFIMNRQVDHTAEVAQGLNLGLWTTSEGSVQSAEAKKNSWNVFKYMDTNLSSNVTQGALPLIGTDSWAKIVPNYTADIANKTNIALAPLQTVSEFQPAMALPFNWKEYGAVSSMTNREGGITVTHNKNRNKNALWGFTQNFGQKFSFANAPAFCTTVTATGSSNGYVNLKLRFLSGSSRILEASQIIPANTPIQIYIPLNNWVYLQSVTGIQVLMAPAGGSWKKNATLDMDYPVGAFLQ